MGCNISQLEKKPKTKADWLQLAEFLNSIPPFDEWHEDPEVVDLQTFLSDVGSAMPRRPRKLPSPLRVLGPGESGPSIILINPTLFLGSVEHAVDIPVLRKLNIQAVLNCASSSISTTEEMYSETSSKSSLCSSLAVTEPPIAYSGLPADDSPGFPILSYIPSFIPFLLQHHQANRENVLVHCVAGMSRSPTVVIAFLMIVKNMTLRQAAALTLRARPLLFINNGFLKQLIILEKKLQQTQWWRKGKKNRGGAPSAQDRAEAEAELASGASSLSVSFPESQSAALDPHVSSTAPSYPSSSSWRTAKYTEVISLPSPILHGSDHVHDKEVRRVLTLKFAALDPEHFMKYLLNSPFSTSATTASFHKSHHQSVHSVSSYYSSPPASPNAFPVPGQTNELTVEEWGLGDPFVIEYEEVVPYTIAACSSTVPVLSPLILGKAGLRLNTLASGALKEASIDQIRELTPPRPSVHSSTPPSLYPSIPSAPPPPLPPLPPLRELTSTRSSVSSTISSSLYPSLPSSSPLYPSSPSSSPLSPSPSSPSLYPSSPLFSLRTPSSLPTPPSSVSATPAAPARRTSATRKVVVLT